MTATTIAMGTSTRACPKAPTCTDASAIGCADKTREGFMGWSDFPLIASLAAAPGAAASRGRVVQSGAAGNHGTNTGPTAPRPTFAPSAGTVCYGPDDVAQRMHNGDCTDAVDPWYPNYRSGAILDRRVGAARRCLFASAARTDGVVGGRGRQRHVRRVRRLRLRHMRGASNAGGFLRPRGGQRLQGRARCRAERGRRSHDRLWLPAVERVVHGQARPTMQPATLGKTLPDRQGGAASCKDSDSALAEVCDGLDTDADGQTDETVIGGTTLRVGDSCPKGGERLRYARVRQQRHLRLRWHAALRGYCRAMAWMMTATCARPTRSMSRPRRPVPAASVPRPGQLTCVDGDEVDSCEGGDQAEGTDVTRDGLDGDCDGATTKTSRPVRARAATARAPDFCAFVKGWRLFRHWRRWAPSSRTTDATCDAIDDDCDGVADEDVAASATTCARAPRPVARPASTARSATTAPRARQRRMSTSCNGGDDGLQWL